MNSFARRDQILDGFEKESEGSFSAVYRALSELSREKQSSKLEESEVKERIRSIVGKRKDKVVGHGG